MQSFSLPDCVPCDVCVCVCVCACVMQPMDILKLTQRKGQSREWDCLPNFSFGFTRLHKGEWNKAERRNLVI